MPQCREPEVCRKFRRTWTIRYSAMTFVRIVIWLIVGARSFPVSSPDQVRARLFPGSCSGLCMRGTMGMPRAAIVFAAIGLALASVGTVQGAEIVKTVGVSVALFRAAELGDPRAQ